jgi:hypothetical protein
VRRLRPLFRSSALVAVLLVVAAGAGVAGGVVSGLLFGADRSKDRGDLANHAVGMAVVTGSILAAAGAAAPLRDAVLAVSHGSNALPSLASAGRRGAALLVGGAIAGGLAGALGLPWHFTISMRRSPTES